MARGELLSVLGLYKYDNTLFDNIQLPSAIDKDVLVNNILLDCAELEVVYPNPTFMKDAIGIWSQSRLKTWNDMMNVLNVEDYKPFINLERRESGYDSQNRNLTSNGEILNKISAFNSNNLENKDSSTTTAKDSGNIRNDYEHNIVGDSALFSKQNIIEQEMKLRKEFDLYKIILDEFKMKFCLLIY